MEGVPQRICLWLLFVILTTEALAYVIQGTMQGLCLEIEVAIMVSASLLKGCRALQ